MFDWGAGKSPRQNGSKVFYKTSVHFAIMHDFDIRGTGNDAATDLFRFILTKLLQLLCAEPVRLLIEARMASNFNAFI
jgi:hypothetical protein